MLLKSPFPMSLVVVITISAFAVICIFTGSLNIPDFSRSVSPKRIHADEDKAPLYLGGTNRQRAPPSFLISSKRNRTFLKKVEDEILKGRDPSAEPGSGKVGNKWFAVTSTPIRDKAITIPGTLLFSAWPTVYRREDKVARKAAPTPTPTTPTSEKKFGVAERGFWKGEDAVKFHVFDDQLAKALIAFFKNENVTTIMELGAGMGIYAKDIKAAGIGISCYDGNPSTQNISEGRCAVADFSRPLDFHRHEWVLSLEVGEHIPAVYEDVFISNLDRGNRNGMILSWGIQG